MNTVETIGMKIMKDVGVGLEKDNLKVILEGTIEVAVVSQGQDQEWVLIEIGLYAIIAKNMTILQKTVWCQK